MVWEFKSPTGHQINLIGLNRRRLSFSLVHSQRTAIRASVFNFAGQRATGLDTGVDDVAATIWSMGNSNAKSEDVP
jgi:hypothetical protein